MRPTHSTEYASTLRSPFWQSLRSDLIAATGWHCERCGDLAYDLELHHLHYQTLGAESLADVELVCRTCHRKADIERKDKAEEDRWTARVEGWARAVYGRSWRAYSFNSLSREFEDFLLLD